MDKKGESEAAQNTFIVAAGIITLNKIVSTVFETHEININFIKNTHISAISGMI